MNHIQKIDQKQQESEQREQLRLAWNAHFRAADVTEIRALRVPTGRGRPATVSGYFDNADAFIEAAMSLNRRKAEGIYFIPNEIDASLLSRRANRLEDYADATTSDHDVKAYRRILIDVDPVRPKGISSSEAELRAAQGVMSAAAEKMNAWFACGKPATVATSGNGWHITYCVEARNTPEVTAAVKAILAALAKECDTGAAKVDCGNFNPSRIWKLPGTFARKGDSTPDRPHRLARLIQVEESPYVISESAVLEFAAPRITTPAAAAPATRTTSGRAIPPGIGESPDTLAAYLLEKGVNVKSRKDIPGGGVALLVDCIIAPEHGNNCTDTAVIWRPNAPIGYECKHSRCSDATWLQFREKLDPGRHKTGGRLEIGDIDHGGNGDKALAPSAKENTPVEKARTGKPFPLTDLGNSERIAALFANDIRFVAGVGFLVWDSKRWREDDIGGAMQCAKQAIRNIWNEAAACANGAAQATDETERQKLGDFAAKLGKWAFTSEARTKIVAALELAKSHPTIALRVGDLDSHPWLLNVNNGTLNLQTGELGPHEQSHHITKLAPFNFKPDAKCDLWLQFLYRIFDGSESMICFAQRAFGSTLAGKVLDHVLHIPYGSGANGKTTALETIGTILGSYAGSAAPKLLIKREGNAHPTELADLRGKRFVWSVETGDGGAFDEERVKALTGGDKIKARRMREDFFEFEPSHTLFLATNHRPVVRGDDEGIWRRIRLWPFDVIIPEVERDRELKGKLEAEADGILGWLVQGCIAWQRHGLNEPGTIREATAEYRVDQDRFGAWFDECCETPGAADDPGRFYERGGVLYQSYVRHHEANGIKPVSNFKFSERLRQKPGVVAQKDRGTVYFGVRLTPEALNQTGGVGR